MGFISRITTPAIKGVVERHPGFELFEIIRIHAGLTERRREQPRCFRGKIEARRIRSTHDDRKPL